VEGIAVPDSLASVGGRDLVDAFGRTPFRLDSHRHTAAGSANKLGAVGLGRTAGFDHIGLGIAVVGVDTAVDILDFHRRNRTGSSLAVVHRSLAADTAGSLGWDRHDRLVAAAHTEDSRLALRVVGSHSYLHKSEAAFRSEVFATPRFRVDCDEIGGSSAGFAG
jgi:hypothetical protein